MTTQSPLTWCIRGKGYRHEEWSDPDNPQEDDYSCDDYLLCWIHQDLPALTRYLYSHLRGRTEVGEFYRSQQSFIGHIYLHNGPVLGRCGTDMYDSSTLTDQDFTDLQQPEPGEVIQWQLTILAADHSHQFETADPGALEPEVHRFMAEHNITDPQIMRVKIQQLEPDGAESSITPMIVATSVG